MSYYKYAKRGADTRVDWSAISTNLVKTLKDQEADRETQRQEIDKESVAVGKRLADAPQGANKAASTWILNASADAAQLMMTQNRLLKSGIVDPRDFTINRQNVDNSFAALKTIADTANKESELTMKRINAGEGQPKSMQFEGVAAQRVNNFQDFSKTRVFWNPDDGVASIGILNKLGTLSDNPADFSTIEGAVNQMQARYDKIEYTPSLQKWADSLGENIQVVNKNGVLTVSDPSGGELDEKTRKEVMASLDDTLSALMVNDIHTLSMAEDLGLVTADDYDLGSKDTSWEIGLNEEETNRLSELEEIKSLDTTQQAELDKLISKRDKPSRKVGVTTQNDGILFPKSNDALNEAVREKLRTDALAMVGYKETAMPKDRAAESFYRLKGEGDKDNKDILNAVGVLYSGTDDEIDGAIKSLSALNPEIRSVSRTKTGVNVILNNGDTIDLPFYDGESLTSGLDWTIGAAGLITGKAASYNEIAQKANWNPLRPDFNTITEKEFQYGTVNADPRQPYEDIKAGITEALFDSDDEATVTSSVAEAVANLGFTVKGTGVVRDVIEVTNPKTGESVEIRTSDSKAAQQQLLGFISSQITTTEDIMRINLQSTAGGAIDYENK